MKGIAILICWIIIPAILLFLVPTVNYEFIANSMIDRELNEFKKSSNSNFEKIFVTAAVAVDGSIEEDMVYDLKRMDKAALPYDISRIFENIPENEMSFKEKMLATQEFTVKERPGFWSGLKNGIYVSMKPLLFTVGVPAVVVLEKMDIIKNKQFSEVVSEMTFGKYIKGIFKSIWYSIKMFFVLLFMKGTFFYYITYIFGCFLGLGFAFAPFAQEEQ